MGKLGKKIGGAIGGILGGEASKSGLAKKAYGMGIGNQKLVKDTGRKLGEKVGSLLPFKNGGVVMVVRSPRKRRTKK
jgi:hypothetical protein